MPKPIKDAVSEDEIRVKILEYFYNAYKNPRGMSSCKIPISKATSDLKKVGLEKPWVIRNMIYLIENGWLKKETEESQFYTGKRTVISKKELYRIASEGVDYFEKSSKFQKENKLSGINVTNIQGIIAIGNNNYIRNEFTELFESLEALGKQVRISSELNDEEKFNVQADMETIKSQLAKPKPDKDIIKKAWNTLKFIATINGVVSLYNKVAPIVEALIK
jgi:hypothetical protein